MRLVTVKSNLGTSLEIKLKSIREDKGIPKGKRAKIQRIATTEIKDSLESNFDRESYGSKPWAKLQPWYATWKKNHGFSPKKLQQTGEMKKNILAGKVIITDTGKQISFSYSVFMGKNVYKYMVPLTGAYNNKQSVISKKMYGRKRKTKAVLNVAELGSTGGTGFIPQRRWDYIKQNSIDRIALAISNEIADAIGKQ